MCERFYISPDLNIAVESNFGRVSHRVVATRGEQIQIA